MTAEEVLESTSEELVRLDVCVDNTGRDESAGVEMGTATCRREMDGYAVG